MNQHDPIMMMKPSDMSKQTLQNAIIYLHKQQENCDKYNLGPYIFRESTAEKWIEILRKEWASRD